MSTPSTVAVGRSSSSKKRVLISTPQSHEGDKNESKERPIRRSRTSNSPPGDRSLESTLAPLQVKALQQQLDHERSLRALDARKAQQTQQRLERQVQFVVEEANEYKTMLSEFQQESEKHALELRADRDKALEELRDCQYRLNQFDEEASYQYALVQEQQSKALVERQLEAKCKQVDGLQGEIEELKKNLKETLSRKEVSPDINLLEGASSPAPKAVLRELNDVRNQLAESERKHRQLERASDHWHDQSKLYIKEREKARSATARVNSLEEQLRQSQASYERLLAEQVSWKEFAKTLRQQLQLDAGLTEKKETDASIGCPPEVVTIMRHFKVAQKHLQDTQDERSVLERRLQTSEQELESARKTIQEKETNETRWERERKQLQEQLDFSQHEFESLQAKETAWKREAEGLRSLMQLYEDFPPIPSSSTSASKLGAAGPAATGPKVASLELHISTLQEELILVQDEKSRLAEDRNSIVAERDSLQQEQDRLQTRFAKLQAALATERNKAQEAEERACKLEALAGKGAFNSEESRAIHLQQNPLTEAITAKYEKEIQSLKKRLAEVTSTTSDEGGNIRDDVNISSVSPATGGIGTPQLDPEKFPQRLREQFTEHAALFREAVYLITGYKVDMLQGRARPTFRVRSVYAEKEHDELIFMWPKNSKEPGGTISLDLMDTPYAKTLSTTDSYQYMTKFKSLPAFIASVQLNLFETVTVM